MAERFGLFWFLLVGVHHSVIGVHHRALDEPSFFSSVVRNIHQCHNLCVSHVICIAYNYDVITRNCQLFSKTSVSRGNVVVRQNSIYEDGIPLGPKGCSQRNCHDNEVCVNLFDAKRMCALIPGCPAPVIANTVELKSKESAYPHGMELSYRCKPGFMPDHGLSKINCKRGVWSTMFCKRIRSCSDVQQCNNSYGDGQYWIYPNVFEDRRVKIYCHHLNSNHPQEFVSLMTTNVGYSPPVQRKVCSSPETYRAGSGKTFYKKIRVEIQEMVVVADDVTFAETIGDKVQKYGQAGDCYVELYGGANSCGPRGSFNINTKGTGLIVDKTLTFPVSGFKAWGSVHRKSDGTKIDLKCGGFCGSCVPSTSIKLHLNIKDEPDQSSATIPECI